jgi:hypothetical protein
MALSRTPDRRREIGSVEDRANFLHRQVTDELLIVAFDRDSMDATDLLQGGGHPVFHIAHERLDGGESQVPCRRAVAAILFDMREEGHDHRRVEVLDRQPRRAGAEPPGREVEQQLEAERVGLAALRAIAPLARHVVAQKAGDERGELGHAALSLTIAFLPPKRYPPSSPASPEDTSTCSGYSAWPR